MSHSISATEKIYVFNALVKASEDVVPGEIVKGSVYFDTTQPNLNLQEITVKVESLEYHVSPPTASANAADDAVADAANVKNANSDHHHKGFLDFFKRHGKAPGLSLNIASHVQNDSNKFELVVPITTAPAIINAGRHEYPFEVTIPTNIPVTSAVQKNADDVVLLLYRYHAVIKIEGATEDGVSIAMKRAAECVVVVAAVDTQAETAAAAMMEDEYDGAAMSQLLMDPTLLPTVPKRRMPSNNFNDGVSFPQLDALPYAHNPLDRSANIYYRIMDGGSFVRPVRHWCLLAEIVRVDVDACSSEGGLYPRPRVSAVISVDGRRGVVEFNAAQAPETFGWADLRPGSTIAVLYAQLQPPAVSSTMPIQSDGISSDEDEGPCVWVADLGDVFVFNATMSILRYYAQSITIKATDTVNLSPQAVAVQWLLELMDTRFTTYASFRSCPAFTSFFQ